MRKKHIRTGSGAILASLVAAVAPAAGASLDAHPHLGSTQAPVVSAVETRILVFASLSKPRSLPPRAAARPGYTVISPSRWSSFQVRATNGYLIDVYAFSRGEVVVEASSRDGRVAYLAHARVSPDRVQAKIGHLGRISMRFHRLGPWEKSREPQGDCRGRRAIVQKGVFRGLLKWRGERGFATARATSASGLSVASYREVCKGENAGTGNDKASEPTLTAKSRRPRGFLEVQTYDLPNEPLFIANLWEPGPRLGIYRSLSAVGGASNAEFSPSGAATISPPPPFSGGAEFQPIHGATGSWSGTLTGFFPGLGSVPLAGPTFSARRAKQ